MKHYLLFFFALISCTSMAVERTILIGPKTIGRGWKDNIVLEARHFAAAQAGDILTVYYDQAKRTAQGAFQHNALFQGTAVFQHGINICLGILWVTLGEIP